MSTATDLTPLFRPHGIVVVGASPRGNRGLKVLSNLERLGYDGPVYAVNPKYANVGGYPCVPRIGDLPERVDLVLAAVAAERVVPIIDESGRSGIRSAVVISSGFGDGGQGSDRGAELRATLDAHAMVAVGPNCYGILDVHERVAAYAGSIVNPLVPGGVALVLQSGALSHSVTDSAVGRGLGLSALVTTGNELSLTLSDYVSWFVRDPRTNVIGIFLEGLRDAEEFAEAARAARAAGKPVVVLATGRSDRGRAAALAHTGAISGSSAALSGLLRSVGAVQVGDLDEFRETLLLLSTLDLARSSQSSRGHGAAITSVSGAGTGLIADLSSLVGLDLPEPTDRARQGIQAALPDFCVASNPLDATGTAAEDGTILPTVMGHLADHPDVGIACFAFNIAQGSGGQEGFYQEQAELLATYAESSVVPTVGLSMAAGPVDPRIVRTLGEQGVPLLNGMRPGLTALAAWSRWVGAGAAAAPPTIDHRPIPGERRVLDSRSAFSALTGVGIAVPRYEFVHTPEQAANAATRIGFPCVLKIESADIQHKTEIGGVRVGLHSSMQVDEVAQAMWSAVRSAVPHATLDGLVVQRMVDGDVMECLVGVVRDPQVGLVLSIAPGGVFVELTGDAQSLPVPVDRAAANSLIDSGPLGALLAGYRGEKPFDREALVDLIVSFSELAASYGRELGAAEVNPVLVGRAGSGAVAVDCLIVRDEKEHKR
jgi:acetyltransferase